MTLENLNKIVDDSERFGGREIRGQQLFLKYFIE